MFLKTFYSLFSFKKIFYTNIFNFEIQISDKKFAGTRFEMLNHRAQPDTVQNQHRY